MKKKRGQLTIFIIIAIMVVAIGTLLYLFWPRISSVFQGEKNPQVFIQECMEEEIGEIVEIVSLQGGSLNPEAFYTYNGNRVEYLCYMNKDYAPFCVVQQPYLREHVKNEIKTGIEDSANSCFDSMRESFIKRGYGVSLSEGSTDVELLPGRVVTTFNRELTLTKGNSERYERFVVVLDNNIYELISIANSIVNSEAKWGDADTDTLSRFYHELVIMRPVKGDDGSVYVLKWKDDKFQFASKARTLGGY